MQRLRGSRDHLGLTPGYPWILLVCVNLAMSPPATLTPGQVQEGSSISWKQQQIPLFPPAQSVCQWWPDPSARAVSLCLSLSPVSFLPCLSLARSGAVL